MTIRYRNGFTVEAVLISEAESSMRVAMRGNDDVIQLKRLNGNWVTEDCEPVEVAAAWEPNEGMPIVTLDDCICPHELAARLLQMLFSGENDPELEAAIAKQPRSVPVCTAVV